MRESAGYREAVARGTPEAFYEELYRGPVRDPLLGVVLVGTYSEARRALDTRRGEYANSATLAPLYRPEADVREELGDVFHAQGDAKGLAVIDGEAHRERRRRALAAFSVVPPDDDHLAGLVAEALDGLDRARGPRRGAVDVVEHFVAPLVMRSSLEDRTGIPPDLAGDLATLLQGQVELLWGLPSPEQQRVLVKDLRRVWQICVESVERNRAALEAGTHTPNIITGYLGAVDGLVPGDVLDIYGHVNAGYMSNVHTLSNLVVASLRRPGGWGRAREERAGTAGLVDELLARHSGTHGWFKVVAAPGGVDVGGEHLPAGTRVLVALNAANQARDRGPGDPNLTFSHGPHTCLGRDFSLRLLTAALRGLVERYPGATLAGEPRPWANLAFNGYPRADVELAA